MSFFDRVTVAFLEEDNAQRAFFRIRPLFNRAGLCSPEDLSLLPDDGFARIVPDKNEQANFKDRMRMLGNLCLIDLTPFPMEANKVRTNKNYAPDKGEKNQYILYSDVIHALPDSLIYEVIEVKDEKEVAEKTFHFVTPHGYVRMGNIWYGPFKKGQPIEEATIMPDQSQMLTITLPNGRVCTFLWQGEASEPVQMEDASNEISFSEASQAIKAAETHLYTLETPKAVVNASPALVQMPVRTAIPDEAPLSGTPLYSGIAARSRMARPRNPLHEVVDAQWRAAKYEAPSAQLQQGASLRHVENPMEHFRHSAEMVWSIPETQQQAMDVLLALPGMQKSLEMLFRSEEPDGLLAASMRHQLQDMEAERLSLLIQIDKAKECKAAIREEIIAAALQEQTAKLKQLRDEIALCQAAEDKLHKEISELLLKRDVLQSVCDELAHTDLPTRLQGFIKGLHIADDERSVPLYLTPVQGEKSSSVQMITALHEELSKQWGSAKRDDAIHFLVLFSLCPQIQLVHPSLAEGARFGRICMEGLGLNGAYSIQTHSKQKISITSLTESSSPVCVITPYFDSVQQAPMHKTLLLSKDCSIPMYQIAYEMSPWPIYVLPLSSIDFASTPDCSTSIRAAISLGSLHDFASGQSAIPPEAITWLNQLQDIMIAEDCPLPLKVCKTITAYLSLAGNLMNGGVAAAADYAFMSWIAPLVHTNERLLKALKPHLPALPRSASLLKQLNR